MAADDALDSIRGTTQVAVVVLRPASAGCYYVDQPTRTLLGH